MSERSQRRLLAILSADVANYSRMMSEDEEGTLSSLDAHLKELVAQRIEGHGGRVIKTMGDGLLVEFDSVIDAVRCAVEIQEGMSQRNANVPVDRRIVFRIGVNVGDVIVQDGDIFGDGVNVAARLQALAEPGGICISRAARDHVRDKLSYRLQDCGEIEVKNIRRPIRVFRISDTARGEKRTKYRLPKIYFSPIFLATTSVVFMALATWVFLKADFFDGYATSISQDAEDSQNHKTTRKSGIKPSLIVLPFKNLGGDQDQEYFSDGLTEDLTTALTRIPGLLVVARNTAFTYKGKNVDAISIGKEIGARYLLEGSARKQSDRLRMTAQLIDTDTGNHIWAESFDRPLEDIFIVQDELVNRIVGSVAAHLRRREGERSLTAAPETLLAYDLSMRGRMLFKRNELPAVSEARELLRKAVASDPSFALAYSLLAEVELYFYTNKLTDEYAQSSTMERVIQATSRAAALAPNDAYVRAVHGIALRSMDQYETAEDEARRALELSPNDPDVLAAVAVIMLGVGDYEETVNTVQMAWALDPFITPFIIGTILAQAQFALGDYQESIDSARYCIQRVPSDVRCHESLVRGLGEIGTESEKRAAVSDFLKLSPNYSVSDYIRRARTNRKDADAIERWADGLRKAGVPEA